MCPHFECKDKERTLYAKKGNLLRHFNGRMSFPEMLGTLETDENKFPDVKINEICAICGRSFDCLRTFVTHCEYCSAKPTGSDDAKCHAVARKKELCRIATQELNNLLKKARGARSTSSEEDLTRFKEGGPRQKRRRLDRKAFSELEFIAQTHQPHQVQEDCGSSRAGILRFCVIIKQADA